MVAEPSPTAVFAPDAPEPCRVARANPQPLVSLLRQLLTDESVRPKPAHARLLRLPAGLLRDLRLRPPVALVVAKEAVGSSVGRTCRSRFVSSQPSGADQL
jgi:hypothetical protein